MYNDDNKICHAKIQESDYEEDDEIENEIEDEDDYKVGYKCPPKNHQFKSGQSGNPKGRPKVSSNLQEALARALYSDIEIKENSQVKKVKVLDAIAKRMVSLALGGNISLLKEFTRICDSRLMQQAIKELTGENKKALSPPSPKVKAALLALREVMDQKLVEEGHFDKNK